MEMITISRSGLLGRELSESLDAPGNVRKTYRNDKRWRGTGDRVLYIGKGWR